jgi:predicted PurR-regulated permease PerM
MSDSPSPAGQGSWLPRFLQAVGIVVGVGVALLVVCKAAEVLLLAFGGALLAILLRGISCWIHERTRLPIVAALALVVVVLLGLFTAAIIFLSPSIGRQLGELQIAVTQTVGRLQEQVGNLPFLDMFPAQSSDDAAPAPPDADGSPRPPADPLAPPQAQPAPAPAPQPESSGFRPNAPSVKDLFTGGAAVLRRVAGVFSTAFGAIAALLIVILIGLFFAANPETYRNGFLRLLPLRIRPRIAEVLDETAHVLRWWILGQMISMTVVGGLVTLGLWLLGVPLAPVLGLLSALLTFVPYLGPIVSAIPGLLIAWSVSPTLLLYALILYVVVENLEGSVITPLVQQQAVRLPPVLTIGAQMLAAVVWGVLGIVFATPLVAAAMVLIKRLYVEDVLGDSFDKPATRPR